MAEIKQLETLAAQVRRDIVRMVSGAASGHPGGSLGATDTLVALYFDTMRIPQTPAAGTENTGIGEDLFFLSNGHISPVWYSVLARKGYFPVSELSGSLRARSDRDSRWRWAQHWPSGSREMPNTAFSS